MVWASDYQGRKIEIQMVLFIILLVTRKNQSGKTRHISVLNACRSQSNYSKLVANVVKKSAALAP